MLNSSSPLWDRFLARDNFLRRTFPRRGYDSSSETKGNNKRKDSETYYVGRNVGRGIKMCLYLWPKPAFSLLSPAKMTGIIRFAII